MLSPPLKLIYLSIPFGRNSISKRSQVGTMGQSFGRLWERIQGKPHLKRICDKVFAETQNNMELLALSDLHRSVLLAYNLFNKHFPGMHKEPPSIQVIETTVKKFHSEGIEQLDSEKFYKLMLEWTSKDRRQYVRTKFVLAIMAAPAMAEITKRGGQHVPSIGNVIQKIPAPIFIPPYIVGLILMQDFSVKSI